MTVHSIGPRTVSIVRMPDGRWGAQNESDTSNLTAEDLEGILLAFRLWFDLQWARRGNREES